MRDECGDNPGKGMKDVRFALRPDAQAFDEIRIVTVPRYKMSGLSGDEWRISASLQLWRKGKMIHERSYGNVEMACAFASAQYLNAIGDGLAFFGGGEDLKCDQEGCSEPAAVFYRLKHEFCRDGHKTDPYESDKRPLIRCFCGEHKRRGDCALEDADVNYEKFDGMPASNKGSA